MLYFDTSFVAPLILSEATSVEVERFIQKLPPGELAISHWTRVEFSSLLARDVRMGRLTDGTAEVADTRFELVIEQTFVVLSPVAADFDLAKSYLTHYECGLRGGDALHFAIAKNNRCRSIYTLDKKLLKAGNLLGLPVGPGIRIAAR